ncbi:penicillin-binding protein 1B [Thalassotalea sp. PS06]|uniref:penicillin-binding protein 1B n=1 Tax=Thalassotalea sp. PS06 TaxID=2594005 RepID=UPI00116279D8|nr:penicillin-binding protein 1B [Thalassotalea sp. PS06]QDP00149.1 penicillin-binding protein 1B [Thalassotalea sp. PS06]
MSAKAKSKNKKPSKNQTRAKTHGQTFTRYLIITGLKLAFIGLVLITAYGLYLDGKVRHKFEGQRWQVPAQVYGAIPTFTQEQNVNFDNIELQLLQLKYSRVSRVDEPGEFTRKGPRLIIYRRQFDFGLGLEAPAKIEIEQKNGEVYRLTYNDHETYKVQLEPILLERIVSSQGEDRVFVPLEQIPQSMVETLLFVEDKDFYHHHGLSFTGIARAFWSNLRAGARVQGGSTLTQQLAKNMYLNREKTLWRKINEAIIAVILELRYSKDQILEAYVNEVYVGQHYGSGIYGMGLASNFYFGKPLSQLDEEQIALLVGIVKGPSYYDPWKYPERATERRDLVLRVMFENHLLDRETYQQGIESGLNIRPNRRFAQRTFPAYSQQVRRELKQFGASQSLQSGLRIFTGFDFVKQLNAERTVLNQLDLLEQKQGVDDLQTAMIVTNVKDASIAAIVGDRNVKYSGFNRALDAKRPIGSLIKPAVYLSALERFEQYNLATPLADEPITLQNDQGQTWQPKNYDGKFREKVTLIQGLSQSLNIPTVNLGMTLGLDSVADTLNALGYEETVPKNPSTLLGSISMSPLEVNQWYSTIANNGMYNQSRAITAIYTSGGKVIWEQPQYADQRLSLQGAYLIDYALKKVTKEGTAKRLSWQFPDLVLAGKTGTSNDLRDSWFVGFDQQTLVTTWIGRDDNKPMGLTGSSGALSLFSGFFKAQGGASRFDLLPEGIEMTDFEVATGNAVTSECMSMVRYPAVRDGLFHSDQCLQPKPEKKSWFQRWFGGSSDTAAGGS